VKVYLCAGYSRREELQEIARQLIGHAVVSRWVFGGHETPEIAAHGIADDQPAPAEGSGWAAEDVEDVARCEVLVAFADGPKIACWQCEGTGQLYCDGKPYPCFLCNGTGGETRAWQRGGRHVEFGLALAQGKHLILVGQPENVFHHLPQVRVIPEVGERCADLLAALETTA